MELKELEAIRKRKIFKLFFLLILNTVIMFFALWYLVTIASSTVLAITFFVLIVIYILIFSIPKNFENDVKTKLLPYLLKNIIKENGEIKWQGEQFKFEKSTSEEKIIKKLEKEIDKHCSTQNYSKNNIDKYIEYLEEKDILIEKEVLTQAEEARLKELEDYISKEDQRAEAEAKEKYTIRAQLLKTLNNNLNLSKEDHIKIEYLKKENRLYEETCELSALQGKNEEELTEEEKLRIDYLEKKLEDSFDDIHKKLTKVLSDTDRDLCLYDIFNRSITYDDVFYGNYKGIEFIAIEGKEEKVFFGTVIRIPLKQEFNNTLLILSKAFNAMPAGAYIGLQTGLQSIKLQTFSNHTVWAKTTDDISNMLNDKFIQYVHGSNKSFSYVFKDSFAYLIWPHKKDFFKLGSLFKKIDDRKQYQNFEKDLQTMLCEIEKFMNATKD